MLSTVAPALLVLAIAAPPAYRLGDQQFEGTHVKAEFFAAGIGWVPVDPTGAVGQGARLDDFYFGRQNADFLTLSLPLEHRFEVHSLGHLNVHNVIGIPFWVLGEGELKVKTSEEWQVTPRQSFD